MYYDMYQYVIMAFMAFNAQTPVNLFHFAVINTIPRILMF